MSSGRKLLAIVPARAGSRGVARKNIRTLNGLPLFTHTVRAIIASGIANRVIISTDDEVIKSWASMHGIEFHDRPAELAADQATISDVALDIVSSLNWNGDVGVFQPTSPLRSTESITSAYDQFIGLSLDSLNSCVRDPHLFWFSDDQLADARPLFSKRENRQFIKQSLFRETGAIQFVTSDSLKLNKSMVSSNHQLFEMPEFESEDIDTISDLRRVQERCNQGLVVFRLTANRTVGTGHLYHCLQLSEYLDHHRVVFVLKDCDPFVKDLLESQRREIEIENNLERVLLIYKDVKPKIIINDVLDTTKSDVLLEKVHGFKVLNIEDLGVGADYADLVINALYHNNSSNSKSTTLIGPKYATLRSEFLDLPQKSISETATKVLVTFGGTDPTQLTYRVSKIASKITGLELTAILGIGAEDIPDISGVNIRRNITNMASEMFKADIVITGAGRTVFEAALTGTPVISIAQNARESTHSHLDIDCGVIFLGIGDLVSDEEIQIAIERLLASAKLRLELSQRIVQLVDGKGAERIANHAELLMKDLL
jgi:CMP-N-acetylneuraminic acid synthetase/spore coat polysaccharide biosynthesis predicted glycosyltransferase SpsG